MTSRLPTYRPWMNVVLYEGAWLVAVLGRERLAIVAFALVALHLLLVAERRREIGLMLVVTGVGIATDVALTLAGVFVFTPDPALLPVPAWLVAIWLAFAATFRHALEPVLARAPLAIACGAIGGPLSYLGAARLGAVSLPYGTGTTALVLGIVWAALTALFVVIVRRAEAMPGKAASS